MTDDQIADRLSRVENGILHEQAVLPGLIRDLEGIDGTDRVRGEMSRWQNELPGWVRQLRSLIEMLEDRVQCATT